jgi:flagellar basal-body rod modification protein FlgD
MINSATSLYPRYTSTAMSTVAEPPQGPLAPTVASPSKLSDKSMGKDEFLKMLVAQLKNQDPLNPMDGKDMAAQLAQFSSVEQLIQLNRTMEAQSGDSRAIAEALAALQAAQAEQNETIVSMIEGQMAMSMVGKIGITTGNAMFVDRDGNGTMLVDSGTRTGQARVTITDASGKEVGQFGIGELKGGQQAIDLQGIYGSDTSLPAGKYTYRVEVATDGGSWQAVKSYSTGRITGLKYENGNPILIIGDALQLPMSQLTQVRS